MKSLSSVILRIQPKVNSHSFELIKRLIFSLKNLILNLKWCFALYLFFGIAENNFGQCLTFGSTGSSINTSGVWQTITVDGNKRYPFNAVSGQSYTFSFCSADGGSSSLDTYLTIINSASSSMAFNDDNCSLQSYVNWVCAATGIYYVLPSQYNGCGTNVSNLGTLAYKSTGPSNDACLTATMLSVNSSSVSGTLTGATYQTPFTINKDVWYKYTPTCTGNHTITLGGLSDDKDLYVYSGVCGSLTQLYSSTSGGSTNEVITQSFSSGVTYFIGVYDYANTGGNFSIGLTGPSLPSQPSAIVGTTDPEVGSTQTYSVSNVSGVSYTWNFPTGWVISSGQNTNSVSVVVGSTNGTITCTPNTSCGNGTARTLSTNIPQYRWKYISSVLGSNLWCSGETRSLSIVIKNTGYASWTDGGGADFNVGVKWNSWSDYHVRVDAQNLAPGNQGTFTFSIKAKDASSGAVYGNNLAAGATYSLSFDIVKENCFWFSSNTSNGCGTTSGNSANTSGNLTINSAPIITSLSSSSSTVCYGGNAQLTSVIPSSESYSVSSGSYALQTCGTNSGPSGDDAVMTSTSIGFTFKYFGVDYSQFTISTNGNIQLGDGSGTTNNPSYSSAYTEIALPNSSVPNNFIALAWDDWNISAGQITFGVTGVSPNRKLVVCFNTSGRGDGGTGTLNGQIVLEETTNKIYLNITSISSSSSILQGIENQNGSYGFSISGRNATSWSASNEQIIIAPLTYSWSPSTFLNSSTISNPIASSMTSGQTYTLTATNLLGCTTSSVVSVSVNSQFNSGTISSVGETICYAGSPSLIGNSTLASGGDNGISYSWRSSADNYTSPIMNATNSTYSPPSGLLATTSYRRYAKDGTCNTTPSVSSGTWTVTVRPQFSSGAINVTGQSICLGVSPSIISNSAVASGGDNSISYSWKSSTDNYTNSIANANSSSYTPPSNLSATTSYRRYARDGVCNTTPVVSSGTWTVTINQLPTSAFSGISSNQNICQGVSYSLTPTTNGGTWSSSVPTFLTISNGAALIPSSVTVYGQPGIITYSVTDANNCSSSSSTTVYLRPIPSAPGLTTSQSFCDGAIVGNLSTTGATAGSTVKWYNDNSNTSTYSSSINLTNGNSYFASQTVNGCESATRTQVVANVDADGTYRSRSTGYWSDATSWNYCNDGATYSVANNAPSNVSVIIQSGHTITGNSAITANTLNVNATGSMVVASTSTLTVSGTITNSGTFDIQSGGQLLQGSDTDISGGGTCIYRKELPQVTNSALSGYNRSYYIGSPVVGASSTTPISIVSVLGSSTTGLNMYGYTETNNSWPLYYSGSLQSQGSTFDIGKGYFVNSSSGTYFSQANFTGNSFNNGDVTVTLTNTAGQGGGYNLISNPYPSGINWSNIYNDASNTSLVGSSYWLRTYQEGAGMTYKTCNASGVSTQGLNAIISPATGFWVKYTGTTPGTFTFKNAMRVGGAGAYYTMNANRIIRLDLGNGTYDDQAVVYMNEDAGLGIEAYDSDKRIPSTTVHQLYSLEGTTKLAINGFNNALAKDTVLLGMQIPTAGTYTINASQIDATIEEDVFLEDKITGAYQNLKTTPSYSFTSTQGTFNNRFVLHFAPYVPALPGQTAATAIAMPTSNWPQCNNVTTEDQWHAFTATSEGISIAVNTATTDIVIELQDGTGNVVAQENAVNGIGNETLNFFGLTAGQIYKVGVRNNISSQPTGTYGICVKSLKRGGCDYGAGPYSLCQYYKATWAGSTGVSYTFTFTGTSGPAAGQTFTRTQNSDICVLSTVTPLLPYGSTYDVVISNTYTLTDGAGNTEQITVPSINGCQVITIAEPQTTLSNSSSCNNGARFRGAVVSSMPWVCGSNNWRWRFTEVNPLTMQEVGLPIELNRGSASNYLNLGTVAQLQNGKTYAVQTAPMFSYTGTNYNWGPVQYMCIVGAAGMTLEGADAAQEAAQGSNKDALQGAQELDAMVYVTEGNQLNIQLTNTANNTAKRADIYDVTGKLVKSVRLVEGMNYVTLNETAGIYMVRTVVGNQSETTRVFVNN